MCIEIVYLMIIELIQNENVKSFTDVYTLQIK